MANQFRILYPGAWYHVMNRGASKQTIFFKMKHRKWFLDLLKHVSKVYKAEIHAYCLMSNHYHLLVRTPEPNLPDIMQHIDSVFTKRVNKDMSRDGPLLRGRYKAILVDQDEYLLPLSRYIHRNPLEAGLVECMNNDLWSSLPYYIGEKSIPRWMHTDFIEGYFVNENFIDAYEDYVAMGNDMDIINFYNAKKLKVILGSKKFIKSLKIQKSPSKEISNLEYCYSRLSLVEICNIVCKISGLPSSVIMQSCRGKTNLYRNVFIFISRNFFGYKFNEIASYLLNCHYSGISAALSRFEKTIINSTELQSLLVIAKLEIAAKNARTDE